MGEGFPYSSPRKNFLSKSSGVSKTPCAEHFLLNSNYRSEIQAKRKQRFWRSLKKVSQVNIMWLPPHPSPHRLPFCSQVLIEQGGTVLVSYRFTWTDPGWGKSWGKFVLRGPSLLTSLFAAAHNFPHSGVPLTSHPPLSLASHCLWLPPGSHPRHCPNFWCITHSSAL